jgi:hypothetical protein
MTCFESSGSQIQPRFLPSDDENNNDFYCCCYNKNNNRCDDDAGVGV